MATVFRADGTQQEIQPKNGTDFDFREVNAVVGGLIEMVVLYDGRVMLLNEEGKINGLPPNAAATNLFNEGGRAWFDVIMGDVLVCLSSEFR